MPETPEKIWHQLGIEEGEYTTWESSKKWGLYPAGISVNKGPALFPRIDIKKELEELEKELEKKTSDKSQQDKGISKQAVKAGTEKSTGKDKELITIEDFAKIDLKVAKVLEAEKIEGADKLLKLKLQLGDEVRQVVSGIAKHYSPEELKDKYVILVANLKPVKLRGIESQGMILAASDDSNLSLITVDRNIGSGKTVS